METTDAGNPEIVSGDGETRRARLRLQIALGLFLLAVVGPIMQPVTAQPASRYLLTAAIWDHGTIQLDAYEDLDPPVLGIDRAVRDGHIYSDKAPLQPVLAVPVYAAYRALGGPGAEVSEPFENVGVWLVTLWSSMIPGAILIALMLAGAQRRIRLRSLAGAFGLFFGTVLLPFSSLLFGHVLAAMFLYAAYLLLERSDRSSVWFAAGLSAGAAVATEYTAVIGVVVLVVYGWVRHGARTGWFVLGGVPPALLLATYHSIAFGSPFVTSYQYSAFSEVTDEARSPLALFTGIDLGNLYKVFFSGRGFLVASSVTILALIGLVWHARLGRLNRTHALVAVAVFTAFLAIPAFWGNPWGGDSPGPRYMVPALPFLVVGLAAAWTRLRLLAPAAVALSVLTMVMATLSNPLASPNQTAGLGAWLTTLLEEGPVDTVFTALLGPIGWLAHLALIAAAGIHMFHVWTRSPFAAGAT